MASLRDLQLGFAHALRSGDASVVAAHVVANGLPPARRVGIYANNVRENFLGTLEATFPTLVHLGGLDWFRQVGRHYLRGAPSRHGNLHYVGERFAAWLEAEVGDGPYAWFVDVARLEWAYQEVLVAAEADALDVSGLGAVAAERYDSLVFEPNPSLRLVESRWPLLAIWRAHRPGVAGPPVDLDSGPSRVLLIRREDHVELRELAPAPFALAQSILRRRPLTAALEQALEAEPGVDLAQCLAEVLRLGVAARFRLLERSTPMP